MSEFHCDICDLPLPLFGGKHKCPPRWEWWPDWDDEEDARLVYATDAEEAAERAFEIYDKGEPSNSDEEEFYVRPWRSKDAPEKWVVYREYRPAYSAHRVEKEASDGP